MSVLFAYVGGLCIGATIATLIGGKRYWFPIYVVGIAASIAAAAFKVFLHD